MPTFGEYLFEFVEETLKEYPSYVLQSLRVGMPTGFDYCVSFEQATDMEKWAKVLKTDLESVTVPSSDMPIMISFHMKSKVSGANLTCRFLESLFEDEDEEDEDASTKSEDDANDWVEFPDCGRHGCKNYTGCPNPETCERYKAKHGKGSDSEQKAKERDGAYRLLIDLMEKMRSEDEGTCSYKASGFVSHFPDEFFF